MPSAGLGGVGPQAAGVQHGFMCDGGGSPTKVAAILPRPAEGTAVDPIALEPVDEVVITTLVDNSFDALMGDIGPARRAPFPAVASVPAPQFEEGRTYPGLIAEHGFSALVTTRRGATAHTVLFDTGVSPDGMASNFERLGLDVAAIEVVVLSHGHAIMMAASLGWLGCGAAAGCRSPCIRWSGAGAASPCPTKRRGSCRR